MYAYSITHHAHALAVADVGVEPRQATQHATQARDTGAADVAETCVTRHRPQQVLAQRDVDESRAKTRQP